MNAGTKLIRDRALQVGEHTEKVCLVEIEARQKCYPEKNSVGILPVRRSAVKKQLHHLYRSVLLGLCLSSGQLSSFFFHTWPTLGPSPRVCARTLQPRWILKWRLLGGARLIMAWHYPLTHKEPLCACVVSSLSLKRRELRSLNPLLKQDFAPLCPCHDCYLKVFTRDRHWLFILFLLLLPFQSKSANWRLIVNASTGAHLSLGSGNANRRLVVNV